MTRPISLPHDLIVERGRKLNRLRRAMDAAGLTLHKSTNTPQNLGRTAHLTLLLIIESLNAEDKNNGR